MKDITKQLIHLLKKGFCVPRIIDLSRELKIPSATIHYNLEMLKKKGILVACRGVFNYKKIDAGFCAFVLVNLNPDEYKIPEKIAMDLAKYEEIESVDIITGEYELIIKIRVKDVHEFYEFIKRVFSKKGITKITSFVSLKQVKTEFVTFK